MSEGNILTPRSAAAAWTKLDGYSVVFTAFDILAPVS